MNSILVAKLALLFGVLFLTMFLRFPFFLACFSAAIAYAVGFPRAMPWFVFGQTFVQGISNQTYASIIFYFFLGSILNYGGLGDRIVDFGNAAIGHVKGSLSHINIIASMIFAGVSGSAIADTASVGNLMIPMMKKQGYDGAYSAAVTQVSSIIGPIIPPSTTFVFISMMMDLSVRKLFLAGFIPGICLGLAELAYSIFISYRRNYPGLPKFLGWKNLWRAFKENFWALLLPVLIIFCLTKGIGTVTEVGAVGCVFALIISCFIYKELDLKGIWNCMYKTAKQMASTMAMLGAVTIFIWIVGSLNFGGTLGAWVGSLGLSKLAIYLFAMLIIFLLGMILETMVITMIFIPILSMPVIAAGIDPYVFAVGAAITCAIGLNTPPVGTLLYLTSKIAEAPALKVAKESLPFIIGILLVVILMGVFPGIALWYPTTFMG